MWKLYGKTYDLTDFAQRHPGGAEIIEKTKGLEDCTALFESYHAFSDLSGIKQSLDKYEIPGVADDDTVIINHYNTDFTTYHRLIEKIKEVFPDREAIKAPPSWYLFVSMLSCAYLYLLYHMLFGGHNMVLRTLIASMISFCEISILFNTLHDSSHYAIHTDANVNTQISTITNAWHLWNHNMWFMHHVYYHHSFTGSDTDPDHHLYNSLQNMSHAFVNTIYSVFPGQYVTQIIMYIITANTYNLYTVYGNARIIPIPNKVTYYDNISISIMLFKLFVIYHYGIIPLLAYYVCHNTFYFMNIAGDHDLFQTYSNHYDGPDWAKRQICNSGNFVNDYRWWSMIFGGINHQIEHHLFPNMSNHHYPTIAPIVKKFCKDNDLPYVHEPTLESTYKSFMKRIVAKKEQ